MNKESSGRRARRVFNEEFKAKVALAALCKRIKPWPNFVSSKSCTQRGSRSGRNNCSSAPSMCLTLGGKSSSPVDLCPLYIKIEQQALEIDFLESALTKAGLMSAGK